MNARGLSIKVPLIVASAIGLRFASLALFTVLAPSAVLAAVLWSATVVQLLSRFIDGGLPSLLRVSLQRRIAKSAVGSLKVWVLFFALTAAISAILLAALDSQFSPATLSLPVWFMVLHCACVTVNNMVLQIQLAGDRPAGIAWNLLAPPLLPMLIGFWVLLVAPGLFNLPDVLYAAYIAGDVALAVASFAVVARNRRSADRTFRVRRLLLSLRQIKTLRFLAAAWSAGLVKTLGQKVERLVAVSFLSPDAYLAVNYALAMRDAIANVSGMSLYRRFNAMLKRHPAGDAEDLEFELLRATWLVLALSLATGVACWGLASWILPQLRIRPFESSAALVAALVSAILPFVHVNVIGQISTARRVQRMNLACQLIMVAAMLLCQGAAWFSGWTPLTGLGPHAAALVVALFGSILWRQAVRGQ